jgi:hypothetical protein
VLFQVLDNGTKERREVNGGVPLLVAAMGVAQGEIDPAVLLTKQNATFRLWTFWTLEDATHPLRCANDLATDGTPRIVLIEIIRRGTRTSVLFLITDYR